MTLTQILHLNVHLFTRRGVFCAHHLLSIMTYIHTGIVATHSLDSQRSGWLAMSTVLARFLFHVAEQPPVSDRSVLSVFLPEVHLQRSLPPCKKTEHQQFRSQVESPTKDGLRGIQATESRLRTARRALVGRVFSATSRAVSADMRTRQTRGRGKKTGQSSS